MLYNFQISYIEHSGKFLRALLFCIMKIQHYKIVVEVVDANDLGRMGNSSLLNPFRLKWQMTHSFCSQMLKDLGQIS